MNDCVMPTYARQPVAFDRGEGVWLWDESGKRYLDAISGVAVCSLGHAHPAVQQALCEQAGRLVHTSNIYRIPRQDSWPPSWSASAAWTTCSSATPAPKPTKRH